MHITLDNTHMWFRTSTFEKTEIKLKQNFTYNNLIKNDVLGQGACIPHLIIYATKSSMCCKFPQALLLFLAGGCHFVETQSPWTAVRPYSHHVQRREFFCKTICSLCSVHNTLLVSHADFFFCTGTRNVYAVFHEKIKLTWTGHITDVHKNKSNQMHMKTIVNSCFCKWNLQFLS